MPAQRGGFKGFAPAAGPPCGQFGCLGYPLELFWGLFGASLGVFLLLGGHWVSHGYSIEWPGMPQELDLPKG